MWLVLLTFLAPHKCPDVQTQPMRPLPCSPCLNLNADCGGHFCCAPLTCAGAPGGPKACLSEPAAPSEVYIATQGKEVDFHIVKPGFTGGNNISERAGRGMRSVRGVIGRVKGERTGAAWKRLTRAALGCWLEPQPGALGPRASAACVLKHWCLPTPPPAALGDFRIRLRSLDGHLNVNEVGPGEPSPLLGDKAVSVGRVRCGRW